MPTTPVSGHGADRLAILRALRDRLTETIDQTTSARDLPPLARRLSDDEIKWVADQVVQNGAPPFGNADIGTLITKVTNELPSETDIRRVADRLEAAGWQVANPSRS